MNGFEKGDGIREITDWNKMTLWQKFNDKDPRRPEKTWRNRWFWTWPITIFGSESVRRDHPRVKRDTVETSYGTRPCLVVKTTKFSTTKISGTYNNIPLSHAFQINWWGWFWGWKN